MPLPLRDNFSERVISPLTKKSQQILDMFKKLSQEIMKAQTAEDIL
jgi:virulence-associated protein VagC